MTVDIWRDGESLPYSSGMLTLNSETNGTVAVDAVQANFIDLVTMTVREQSSCSADLG